MDYSKLSDFEINSAVFEALHGGAPDYKEGDGGAMVLLSFEGDIIGGDVVEVEVERGSFNPCNNISDAWPIVIDNGIGLEPSSNDFACAWRIAEGVKFISKYKDENENPLRSAMIVFLMMQEAANVPANTARSDLL